MGDNTTYKVNDDGSVTVSARLSEQEQDIIEILRIEKSKGGVFACRRMKKRATNHAKSVNYPEFKVEKLMLDNYPDDFANYPKTTSLIVWLIIGIIFLCGAVICTFPAYFKLDDALYYNERINSCEEFQRTGDVEKYCRILGRAMDFGENSGIPPLVVERDLEHAEQYRDYKIKDMIWYLFAVLGCFAISYISLRQYRRIVKQIKPIIQNKS